MYFSSCLRLQGLAILTGDLTGLGCLSWFGQSVANVDCRVQDIRGTLENYDPSSEVGGVGGAIRRTLGTPPGWWVVGGF